MPGVLRWLLREPRKGVLLVRRPETRALLGTVHVDSGRVHFATSTLREPSPGETVAEQLVENVVSLFGLEQADVAFDGGERVVTTGTTVALPSLLVAGARRAPLSRLEVWAGDLDEPLAVTGVLFGVFEGVSLDADESALVERLMGRVTIAELLDATELDRHRALALLVALRYAGALVAASTPPRAWVGDRDPFAAPPAEAAPPPPSPSLEDAARVCYLLDQKLSALDAGADHYAILEVERRASPDAVKASYRELAKIFHPDRHGQLSSADPTVKASLERVFKAVSNAYATLSDPRARETYDRTRADAMQRSARPAPPPAPHRTPRPARPADRMPATPVPSRRAAWPPPPPTPSGPHLEAGQLELLGTRYHEDGDYERAVHAFRKGTSVDPDSAGCHAGLGRALLAMEGLSAAAEASLRRALALDGCSVDLVVEMATIFADHGRAEDARILMKRALRLDPENAAARRALGLSEAGGREGVGGLLGRLLRR